MNVTEHEPWMKNGACRSNTALFASAALDYNPDDPDFADLTADEHADAAVEKARVETEAVKVCMGCEVLFKCEKWAFEKGPVFGVAAGYTEAERAEIAAARGLTVEVVEDDEPAETSVEDIAAEIARAPHERGPRAQVNDAEVDRLSRLGKTAEQIAREIGCSDRSVVRARARNEKARRLAAAQARIAADRAAVNAVVAEAAAVVAEAEATIVAETAQPAAAPQVVSTSSTREASAAMNAIYAVLADGQWHQRDALLDVGARHITDDEALAWWIRINQVHTPNGKVLNPNKADVPTWQRIYAGARDKVNNMLSASSRNRKNTERGGPTGSDRDLYRLTAKGMAALGQREAVAA